MKTDMTGWHRMISGVGSVLLFSPSGLGHRASPGGVLHLVFGRLWPGNPVVGWMLFALAALGFAVCWWARVHLGRLWSGLVTLKEGHRIVDTGPYGLVRHPIYTGVMFAAVATAFVRANPAGFVGAVLLILGFSMTARIEEGFLRAQLGADLYDDYSRRVGMLIPGVG
jgi:protein-S-isoprenylcysteine O-methyltransferase Ste14